MNCCEEDVERRTWEIHFIENNLRELKQKHNCVSCLHHFDDTLWCELDYSRRISCLCIKMSLAWLLDQVALRIRFFLSQPQMSMELENHYCGLCSAYLLRNEGKWHKYGDWRANEIYWVFLCKPCSKHLWRMYSKLEWDESVGEDWSQLNKDYMIFLKHELARLRAN